MQDINFTWPQGEDFFINLRYKEGPSSKNAVPVDLRNGYSASMAIAVPSAASPSHTATTASGDIVLLSGINEPNIRIRLDRSLTLPGGPFVTGGAFVYDLFLRNNADDQVKVMEGTINVKKSVTQWV